MGIKAGWALGYEKATGLKQAEQTKMTEEVNKYKQFAGVTFTNIGWSPVFKDEKLYTFVHSEEVKVDPEILARTVTSIRRVLERNIDIQEAPFGDWVEIVVKAVDAGKNTTPEEYARHISKENGCTRPPRESIWIGQQREFRINEGTRCDLKITIRLKKDKRYSEQAKSA